MQFWVSRLATHEDVSYKDVIDAITRLRPDRDWVGEMSVQNTWILLRLLNTGHSGLLATLHADSPHLAFAAMVRNVQMAGFPIDGVEEYFRDTIDVIIQVHRRPGTHIREITEIYQRPTMQHPRRSPDSEAA